MTTSGELEKNQRWQSRHATADIFVGTRLCEAVTR